MTRMAPVALSAGVVALAAAGCVEPGANTLTGATIAPNACNGPGGGFAGCSLKDSATFTFYDSLPASMTIVDNGTHLPPVPGDRPPVVDGQRFLVVTFHSAQAHDQAGNGTSQHAAYAAGMHRIAEAVLVQDFEGYVQYVIGLNGTAKPAVVSARGAHSFYVIVS